MHTRRCQCVRVCVFALCFHDIKVLLSFWDFARRQMPRNDWSCAHGVVLTTIPLQSPSLSLSLSVPLSLSLYAPSTLCSPDKNTHTHAFVRPTCKRMCFSDIDSLHSTRGLAPLCRRLWMSCFCLLHAMQQFVAFLIWIQIYKTHNESECVRETGRYLADSRDMADI